MMVLWFMILRFPQVGKSEGDLCLAKVAPFAGESIVSLILEAYNTVLQVAQFRHLIVDD